MAGRKSNQVDEAIPLQGSRLVRQMQRLLKRLHSAGTERDTAGNRRLFMDQYMSLLLLYFFNPSIGSLRALQLLSGWEQTRRKLDIARTSLGSLHEAARVFDASLLEPILQELIGQVLPQTSGREAEALRGLTAVDGSVFRGLSRMAWALWTSQHRAVKLHLHFDVLRGGSSFVARVKDDIALDIQEERVLTQDASAAGVVRDVILKRLGTSHHKDVVGRPMRLVIVRVMERDGKQHELWLVTDLLDLDADLVALAYRYRWTIELFFRWLKCVLGTKHLIAENANGVQLQMYAACIVCLLIQLRTGRQPNKRTFEAVQFYLLGWVTDEELDAHLSKLPAIKSEKKILNNTSTRCPS